MAQPAVQDPTALSQVLEAVTFLAPATLVVLSAYLAYAFARRQTSDDRKQSFWLRQVTTFYSPMMGLRSRIRSLSQLRAEINGLAGASWSDIVKDAPADNPALSNHFNREFGTFKKLIEYNNRQLRDELLPLYERMLGVFDDHYWLAEPSTRVHYDNLVRFVELWRRNLDESLPPPILRQIEHSEAVLQPFYDDLEMTLDSVTMRLKADQPPNKPMHLLARLGFKGRGVEFK